MIRRLLLRRHLLMLHWIKFNVVGVLGFGLQTVALFLLTHGARPLSYLGATALAVELAVLNNFFWHQRWTWQDRPSATIGETLRRLFKFNVTNGLISIGGNLVLMSILVGRLDLPITGSNVASVAACSLLNFFLADRIAFATVTGSDFAVSSSRVIHGPKQKPAR
jgi:dolichol-phosphate mannosyltransferase